MVNLEEAQALFQALNASKTPEPFKVAKSSEVSKTKKSNKGESMSFSDENGCSTKAVIVRSVPRQDSPQARDSRNFTTPRPDQQDWSWANLPDILYQLFPSASEKKDRKSDPPLMSYPIHGQYLHYIPILPDNISSTVEEFRVEAWMRLDRRIRLKDITDRMHPEFRIQGNALQQRGVRFRQQFSMVAWDSGNKRSQNLKEGLIKKIREQGIDPSQNSTRGITPGLINLALGEAGGRIPLPDGFNKERRTRRGRKPSKESVQDDAGTEEPIHEEQPVLLSNLPSDELAAVEVSTPEEADAVEDVSDLFNYVPTFVPFDECNDTPDGPLPVIRGVIPDEELPETITMEDADITLGVNNPTPRCKTEKALKPIAPKRIQHKRPSPLKLFGGNVSNNTYQIWSVPNPIITQLTIVSGSVDRQEQFEFLPPSHGLYPNALTPCSEADLPYEIRDQVFDSLFEQCLTGARYLFDVPMITSDYEVMNIEDVNIDDFF
ncbi:hypothetical protein BDV29DRAFT_2346 [Aspergillus leporis]|jgi:hypothetical protein|uniref:Uncharacterized protein n=1 Tax=Aspergillus leporis TaxID=41062 RepID=A0A5N5XC98_9EURO|nr:hypothetical protein BDV29DRAFT_2346 [Aspergillus leporis]